MRPTHTTIAPLAALLAAATLATPATARTYSTYELPPDFRTADVRAAADGRGGHASYELPRNFRTADARDATDGRGTFNAPAVTVVEVPQPAPAPESGVDWTDAAIGAGGATGMLAITLAGAITLRRRQLGARARAAVS